MRACASRMGRWLRELRQHPGEVDQYPDLIRLERLLKRPAEEREYLLAFAKAAPDNAQAVLLAGSRLIALNQEDDAVEVYRAGIKALPDNRMIQVRLGSALLRAGKKEDAVTLLKNALNGTTDANVLNDGAYAPVTEGSSSSLRLAEMSARKAVEILEDESAGTAIEDVNSETFRRAYLLLAAWDALGWLYFAEGKDALAEEYVRASWVFVMQVSAVRTEHVAMLSGDEGLRQLSDALGRLDLRLAVPKESKALLLRSAILVCSTEATCELVLTPPVSTNVK
jgi:tetratricopeptide (TPR) repeat protein